MSTHFDTLTEGERERDLMRRIRGREVAIDDIESVIPPFFVKIQIQTISPCNAACVMCPWESTKDTQPQGRMEEGVFRRIIDQIAGRGVERTSLFLMNEPLIDRRLEAFTALVKEKEPRTKTVIFTNGLLLTAARALSLARAGLDEVDVSVIGFDAATYGANMGGIDFDVVMEQLRDIRQLAAAGDLGAMRIKIVTLDLPGIAESAARFRDETGFEVFVKPVTNRAGLIDVASLGVQHAAPPEPSACQRPFVKAYVLYNGDMVLCNCDWRRTTIIGNVLERPLEELWRSQALMEIRKHHLRRSFPAGSLCATCDYPYLL